MKILESALVVAKRSGVVREEHIHEGAVVGPAARECSNGSLEQSKRPKCWGKGWNCKKRPTLNRVYFP